MNLLSIFVIAIFFLISCRSTEDASRSQIDIEMRGVESDPEVSSILISINRELRVAYEYYIKGDFQKALRVYKKAARGYMKYDYRHRLCTIYSNIGTIFLKTNDLDKAEYYLNLSIEYSEKYIRESEERTRMRAINLYKLGLLFLYKNDLVKAKTMNDESFKLHRELDYKIGFAKNFRVYGLYFLQKNNYPKAIEMFEDALRYNTLYQDYYDTILNRISLSDIYNKLKKYDDSIKQLKRSLIIAKVKEFNEKINLILYKMAECYELQNKMEDALTHYQRAYEVALNLDADDNLRKLRENQSLEKIKEIFIKLKRQNALNEYLELIKYFYYTRDTD